MKTGIGREWRELEFELVAGEPDFIACVVSGEQTTEFRFLEMPQFLKAHFPTSLGRILYFLCVYGAEGKRLDL